MAETASTMLALGTKAPDFTLFDVVSQQWLSLSELASPLATVIMFICNHCPYVKHIQKSLVSVANQYQAKGIKFIAINSNDVINYPADNPDNMRKEARLNQYPFPYLYDETQAVAKAYHAACTPDFYIFNGNKACVYRGRFDAATPGNSIPVTGKDLTTALDNILTGVAITSEQLPSLGCNIKWKKKD
jgi:thiol-disulfide isomerase/thioredoxin